MSKIFDMLVAQDKKKIFDFSVTPSIGYPSGLIPLDYSNGYWARVNNHGNNKIPKKWLNIGTQGGTFYTIIGNSGVGKSALAIAMGSSMVKNFDFGEYYHIDAEGTSNPTRIQVLNKYTDDEMENKYHMPNIVYVEDLFTLIYELAQIKISNKEFAYNTGCYAPNGNEIIIPQPTAVLIDSLPSMQTKDVEDSNELGSQTYNMRLAIAYNTFYKRLRPIIRDANITVFAINHIKEKPQMGFIKTQAKIQYLKPDENIPGGSGPIYYSQNLLRVIYRGKYTKDKNGFDGFLVEALNIKSKTNKSGTAIHLVFHADKGFEPVLTMLKFADDHDLITGRNPYSYFKNDPDHKFNTKNVDELMKDERLFKAMMDACEPYLNEYLGNAIVDNNSIMNVDELNRRLNEAFDDNTNDIKANAMQFMLNTEKYHKIKYHKLFNGFHRFDDNSKNPIIEKVLSSRKNSKKYLKYCIEEMHSLEGAIVE